jgi:DNA helicase II / ATP-dependent DNA helicase PcrA
VSEKPRFIPSAAQKTAIEHVAGPMLVLAGAGTGKTTVLVERIAWLIENGHARPEEILAITFTENGAAELKMRVERRLGRHAAICADTIHAYCLGILKRSRRDFSLLLPEDVYVFLRQRIDQLGLERFIKASDVGQFLVDLHDFFDRCTEELIGPKEFQEYVDSLRPGPALPRNCKSKEVDETGDAEILERWREIARVYSNSMRLLEEENLGSFGMMISRAVELLQSNAELLAQERQRARFILIDEFQDCNWSNIFLAQLLGGTEQNVYAVGDPDQAIYRFRGASSAAFEEFQQLFPHTRGVILDENQRSRGNILRVAFAAINQNPAVGSLCGAVRFERRPLISGRDRRDTEQGQFVFDDPVEAVIASSGESEAADIADEIERLRESAGKRERPSFAVLYRSHFHREKMIEALAARQIPFLVKSMDVLETPMARDLLAILRAVVNERDADSLFRIHALPQFGASPAELRARLGEAGRDRAFRDVLGMMESGKRVLAMLDAAREFIATQKLGASGALTYLLRTFDLPEGDPVVRAMRRFFGEWEGKAFIADKSLQSFLRYLDFYREGKGVVPMFSETEQAEAERANPDAVRLMTIHSAKGLEFTHVWILRTITPGFPAQYREPLFEFPPGLRRSMVTGEGREIHEQEERRLFYVGVTRARDRLEIHSRPGRGKDSTPPGLLRPLLQDRTLASSLLRRPAKLPAIARDAQVEISPAGEWMLLPPLFKTDDLALSAHAVESYSTCPLMFKLERDWRIPGDAAAALQYGSAMHTVLRQYYDPAPHAVLLTAEATVQAFRHEFLKAALDDPVQCKLYLEMGERQLQELLRSRPRGSMDVIGAEVPIDFNLGAQKIRGRIDRLDRLEGNGVRVIDYKSGAPKTPRYAEESLQLSIYALGARAMGFVPKELVFLNLQGNEEIVTDRSLAQLEKARCRIEDVARGIAAGHFSPNPGQHCQWCNYRRLCPATEQRVFVPVKELMMDGEARAAGVDR